MYFIHYNPPSILGGIPQPPIRLTVHLGGVDHGDVVCLVILEHRK